MNNKSLFWKKEIYEMLHEHMRDVLLEVSRQLVEIDKRAKNGEYPAGEYEDALKDLIMMSFKLGNTPDTVVKMARNYNVEY